MSEVHHNSGNHLRLFAQQMKSPFKCLDMQPVPPQCHSYSSLVKSGSFLLSLSQGGYNLHSLAEGVSATLHTLLGDPCPVLESPGAPCPR